MTEPPEVPERGERSKWVSAVVLVVGVAAAVAVGGYLWLSGGDSNSETAESPQLEGAEVGVACPNLREAFTHSQTGDAEALRQSVDAAARAGEQALQQSGQAFGRAEGIAIELRYAISEEGGQAASVPRMLDEARRVCTDLGQWPAPS